MQSLYNTFQLSMIPCAADAVYGPAAPDRMPGVPSDGLTVVAGESGVGKTSLLLTEIVAPYTAGRASIIMYGDPVAPAKERGAVYIVSVENSESQIREMLRSAGADLTKVFLIGKLEYARLIKSGVDLKRIDSQFWNSIFAAAPALLVIDPIEKVVDVDGNKGKLVRDAVMNPLCVAAANHHISIIITTHLNKSEATEVRKAMKGSTEYYDYADSVLFAQKGLGEEEEDASVIIVSEEKCRHDDRHGSIVLRRVREGKNIRYRLIEHTPHQAEYYLVQKARARFVRLRDAKSNKAEDRHEGIANEILRLLKEAGAEGMHVSALKDAVAQATGVSLSTIETVKRSLLAKGTIMSKHMYRDAILWLPEYFPAETASGDLAQGALSPCAPAGSDPV